MYSVAKLGQMFKATMFFLIVITKKKKKKTKNII